VLQKAASIEALSEHPIGSAIVTAATDKGLEITKPNSFSAIAGYGVQATIDGDTILIGAARLMDRENIDRASLADQADTLAQQGQTPFYMAINGKLAALFAVTDPIKDNAAEIIRGLHAMDLKVAMITGDDAGTAQNVAGILGIDTVIANVLPDGKVAALDGLRKDGDIVAFVGDGINDAPALASADIGIAIGSGTDVAIESADMVLMSGDLSGVMRAFAISHATMRNIRQNLFWAFAYNAALIPVAAGVLYPINGMLLSPMLAAGAMALSSVFVVTNALRLRRAGMVA
jgi:Cu+-exporting ATPase